MSDLRSSFRYGLPHRFWPASETCGIVPTRHEQHQRSARHREQVQLKTLLGSIRSGPLGPKEPAAPAVVEGWRNFPGLPVGPRLEQREAKFRREPSMREAAQQLSSGWRSRYHQDPIGRAPKRPQSARAPASFRFAKMFDPKQLPADFRQQLYNLPRPIAARAFKPDLCINGVESELSEDLGHEAPQTPPNTPSHVEPPESVLRRSGPQKSLPSEGKSEGSPSASPSWIQRHMRIPSLTSEISEASAEVETRRSSTVVQEEEIAGFPCGPPRVGEESSSSAADDADASLDASPSGPSAAFADAETSEGYEVLQRHQAPPGTPKVHWLEQQELRIRQQLRHSCLDWSYVSMPRQAGGMVTRNWLSRNRKTGPRG